MSAITTPSYGESERTQMKHRNPRQYGFDVARGLAVFGMVIVNFKVAMGAENTGPGWLAQLTELLNGRAAATFVILAGIGMSLLTNRARLLGDRLLLAAKRTILLKRAVFLFFFGLAYAPLWPADILHFYGIYMLLGALILNVTDRRLISLAVIFMLAFEILLLSLEYDAGWDWQTLTYLDFWTFAGMLRHLFFNGFHPVIPWAAFLILGMWLGRQDMTDPMGRRKLFCLGLGAVILTEIVSHVMTNHALTAFPNDNPKDIRHLFGTGPLPPTMLYMFSAGGTAVMTIVISIVITERLKPSCRLIMPLITTGQFALTFYVAHVVIGMGFLEATGHFHDQSLTMALASALGFCTMGVAVAMIWRKFFEHGPLEWLLRRVTS